MAPHTRSAVRPGPNRTRRAPLVPVDPAGGGMTVQETAERTGLSEHTLRYSLLEEQACEVEDRMRAMQGHREYVRRKIDYWRAVEAGQDTAAQAIADELSCQVLVPPAGSKT